MIPEQVKITHMNYCIQIIYISRQLLISLGEKSMDLSQL